MASTFPPWKSKRLHFVLVESKKIFHFMECEMHY